MQITDSDFLSYNGKPVKEAWLNDTKVWQASSFGWILRPLNQGTWTDVAYGPTDTLVAVGNNRYSYSFNNGSTWASAIFNINPTAGTETYNAVCYGSNNTWSLIEGLAYSPNGSRYSYTSVNPVTGWTLSSLISPLTSLNYFDVLYSSFHNKYIAIGDKNGRATNQIVGMYSTDAVNWLSASYIYYNGSAGVDQYGFNGGIVEGFAMPNHRIVATSGTPEQKLGYSDDGITWKQGAYQAYNSPQGQDLQTNNNWQDVAYGYDNGGNLPLSGRYVATNFNGATTQYQFAYSDDGINWIGLAFTTEDLQKNWSTITYGNGYFIALSYGSQARSIDGKNWLAYNNLPSTSRHFDVEVANNRFVSLLYSDLINYVGCSTADFIF